MESHSDRSSTGKSWNQWKITGRMPPLREVPKINDLATLISDQLATVIPEMPRVSPRILFRNLSSPFKLVTQPRFRTPSSASSSSSGIVNHSGKTGRKIEAASPLSVTAFLRFSLSPSHRNRCLSSLAGCL
ncbi:hypothetical protein E3N88_00326 [Mikania micrantha]|uniref:Uncharacterized protein n=1 Tax=Mikania micrantha TaxID=192012 RepID=A0A5N6Q0H1_9ASTR|nr:hypothetical protein E3N88_00326 [Mikania micrantha]